MKKVVPNNGWRSVYLSTILAVFVTIFDINRSLDAWLLTIVFVLYGFIGFIDDFIKLFMKHNLGLTSSEIFSTSCHWNYILHCTALVVLIIS